MVMKHYVFWDVVCCKWNNISEEHATAIFRGEKQDSLLCAGFLLGLLFISEYGDAMFLQTLVDVQLTTQCYVPKVELLN
jgi:hypothetical protein